MTNKLILLTIFFTISCGKQVSIPNTLERHSSITEADSKKISDAMAVGMLNRGNTEVVSALQLEGVTIEIDEKPYKVSKYSSQLVFTFINSFPKGARVSVKFSGEIKTDDVVVKKIE